MLASGFAGLGALFWAMMGAGESLWVDELHTSWVVADGFEDILDRAAVGNQTAWYFYLVFGFQYLGSALGNSLPDRWLSDELSLRLPSIIAWSLSLALLTSIVLHAAGQRRAASGPEELRTSLSQTWEYSPIVGWCLCVLVDRLQWFYSVEARVYSILQLLSLLGWMIVASVVDHRKDQSELRPETESGHVCWRCCGWAVVSLAIVSLHITSFISVIAQLTVLVLMAIVQPRIRFTIAACVFLLFCAGWSMLGNLHTVWDRRMQWQSIGGDASLSSLANLLPILPLLVPIFVVELVCLLRGFAKSPKPNTAHVRYWLWVVAFVCPFFGAWLLTRFEFAPLFHYRFVITAALPLYALAGIWMLRLPSVWLRWAVVLVSLVWLTASQGTLIYWQRGQLMGLNRNESWRQAVDYVAQRLGPDRDSVWVCSGLIEGHSAHPPLSERENEYLSYPLRGIYEIVAKEGRVEPQALVGRSAFWATQLGFELPSTPAKEISVDRSQKAELGQPVVPGPTNHQSQASGIWIVYRGNGMALETRLQQAGLAGYPRRYPITEFGRVSVVCLEAL